ncbi:MAG: glycosyltransferase [Bryobacteraceae bacterium]
MTLRVALFYHSLVSDWNHGNAHFLRGVASELIARGHRVRIFEPKDGWSRENLMRDYGPDAIERFHCAFPQLRSETYSLDHFDLDEALADCDLVLVHEWNAPELVSRIGEYRKGSADVRVLFHDTHHRAITAPAELGAFDLSRYDGVLAYGASLAEAYRQRGWGRQVHVWHEAADTRVFYPRPSSSKDGDIVWIGNWGDEERTDELREFLLRPVKALNVKANVHGVRYPDYARAELQDAGIGYGAWIANFEVPELFARYRATVHVPRRPYVEQLKGIPTIRPFEALACGIPLVSSYWNDSEGLFRHGQDFLMARNGTEMQRHISDVLNDEDLAAELARSGLETIKARHTCDHRVDELEAIYRVMQPARLENVAERQAIEEVQA